MSRKNSKKRRQSEVGRKSKKRKDQNSNDIVWLTVIGRSPFAVLNSIWAAIEKKDVYPNKFCLLMTENDPGTEESYKTIRNWLPRILEAHCGIKIDFDSEDDVFRVPIEENDMLDFRNKVQNYLDIFINGKMQVIIDITPGRKYMSGVLMSAGLNSENIYAVYYNHLLLKKYQGDSYPLIPAPENQLYDLLKIFEE